MEKDKKTNEVTRRTFLKGVAVGSASVALVGIKPASAATIPKDRRYLQASMSVLDSADPADHMDVGRAPYRLNMFDGLLRWRDNPPKLQPWIAESYESSPDAKVWIFKIRKGVKFHDGSDVTADDIVYTVERLLGLGGRGAGGSIKPWLDPGNTRATDKYTVEFKLKQGFAPFAALTHFMDVVNRKVLQKYEKDKDWGNKWLAANGTVLGKDGVGTGAYTLEKYDQPWGFDSTKFENHFSPWDHPHFEKTGFRTIPETATRLLSLMNGDVQSDNTYLSYDQLQKIADSPNVQVIKQPSLRLFVGYFNNSIAPTNDVHYRKALCYAFDYDGWIHKMQHDMVEAINGPIPGRLWGSLDPKDTPYKYDLDMAKKEMDKASPESRRALMEQAPMIGFPQTLEASSLLQNGLDQIGVKCKIEAKANTQLVYLAIEGKIPPIWWTNHSCYYPDPQNWARVVESSYWGTAFGASRYKNPRVDDLLKKAVAIAAQEERAKLYQEAMKIVVEDAAGLYVHNESWTGAISRNVKGMRFCPVGDMGEYRWMSWV